MSGLENMLFSHGENKNEIFFITDFFFLLPKHVIWTACNHSELSFIIWLLLSSTDWQSCLLHRVNHLSFESSNSQKSIGENTREYTLSARLCPTRNSRCATVHSMQTSSQFPFCRQLLSSEFSAFFMKVNSEMCHITDYKFRLYFTQIIFSLYILFPFSKLWTIQNLQSKLFYILVSLSLEV